MHWRRRNTVQQQEPLSRLQVVHIVYTSALFLSRLILAVMLQPDTIDREVGFILVYSQLICTFAGLCWLAQWAEDEVRAMWPFTRGVAIACYNEAGTTYGLSKVVSVF